MKIHNTPCQHPTTYKFAVDADIHSDSSPATVSLTDLIYTNTPEISAKDVLTLICLNQKETAVICGSPVTRWS